jgi:hypothetical protein
MTHDQLVTAYRTALTVILIVSLILLTGCANTMKVLESADYVCITGDVVGRWTGSRLDGRGVKVPEGEVLTPELVEAICQ